MIVKVTSIYIKHGKRHDCYNCPVSLAVKDAGGFDTVFANERCIDVFKNEKYTEYTTPESAVAFIKAFDKGEQVKAFEFILGKVKS